MQGWFRVKDDVNDQDARHAHGHFWGTLDGTGKLDGFIQGRVNRRLALLVGGMSATFTPDGGFVDGRIGNAAESQRGRADRQAVQGLQAGQDARSGATRRQG